MVRVTGPMLSQDARGKLGSVLLFSKSKQAHTVRQLVTPTNPKTPSQVSFRALTKFLSKQWASLTPAEKETWALFTGDKPSSPHNTFVGTNTTSWDIFDPPSKSYPRTGVGGTILPAAQVVIPSTKSLTLELTRPFLGPDWGWIVYRRTTGPFTPTRDDAVAFVLATPPTTVFRDRPLITGTTYYYYTQGFNTTGKKGILSLVVSGTPL